MFLLQLALRDNDLIEIPKEIGELPRLKELHIQGNRLTVLPPEIGMFVIFYVQNVIFYSASHLC